MSAFERKHTLVTQSTPGGDVQARNEKAGCGVAESTNLG